jgi:hypothetical protein
MTERENWKTVAVTPLAPGWLNAFDNGDGSLTVYPAPALLLQECTTTRSLAEDLNPPTRVVFACITDHGLQPVNDYATYSRSLTERQLADGGWAARAERITT